jgi:pimeloyl-ACP methyl ester carboxylesterase
VAARRANEVRLADRALPRVAHVAALRPTAVAVLSDAGRWDYGRLSDAADSVAQALLRRGMPPGARVGIRMRRSAELVAVVLGAMRAGAAVVPLDPSYPAGRIRSMVQTAAPCVGDSDRVDTEALRSELGHVLPPHMVPAQFHWIDAMPLTPSGKRDDAALRAIGSSGPRRPHRVASAGDGLPEAIAGLLADFAGVANLAVDASFFAAGGTSIGATRAALTIARRWGVDLPLRTFVAAPTARELAGVIRSRQARRSFDPVVPLRESGDQPPLFLVHPIGGNVLCYRELAQHLPGDRPVHGLQAAGAEPGTEPLTSMESLASAYLEAIRRVRPAGAVHLAGWSFGGYVAVEIARQLAPAELSTVTLLDTIALGDGPRPLVDERQLAAFFFRELLWQSAGEIAADDELDWSGQDLGQLETPHVSIVAGQLSDALVRADTRSRAETGAA